MPKKSILRPNEYEYLREFHTIEYCQHCIKAWNNSINFWLRNAREWKRISEPFPYTANLKSAILQRNKFKRLLAAREMQNDLEQIKF